MTGDEALGRLQAGNRRFVETGRGAGEVVTKDRRAEMAAGQRPYAAIVGCADSRVPPEVVFDEAPGNLFVIRVAGNVSPPTVIGSLEFAVTEFNTALVVVLGHTRCGAVTATLEAVRSPSSELSPGLTAIVDQIREPVETVLAQRPEEDCDMLVARAVRANIRAVVESLSAESTLLADRVRTGDLRVVGAEYALETGAVEFLT